MKEKKPVYKKWWFWVIIVCLIILVAGNGKYSSAPEPVSTSDSDVTTEAPLEKTIKDTTKDSYCSITEKDSYLEIVYKLQETPYDYADYVSEALTHCLVVSKYVFKNTDYTQIRMDMKSDDDVVTSLIISKDGFESRDWSAIAYTKGIYEDIQSSFDKFYVESTLLKDTDTNEIKIKDMLED